MRIRFLAFLFAASFFSPTLGAAACAGRLSRAVEASLARFETALATISEDPFSYALGAELEAARRDLARAESALEAHRPRRAQKIASSLVSRIARLRTMLETASEEARDRARSAAAFSRSREDDGKRAREEALAIEADGAPFTSAFPALETRGAKVERVIAASRRRARADESARAERGAEDPRLSRARIEVGQEMISRAAAEASALGALAKKGAALEEQARVAARAVDEARTALAREDFDGVQRATETVAALLQRALAWAFAGEEKADADRRAVIATELLAEDLESVVLEFGVSLKEAP